MVTRRNFLLGFLALAASSYCNKFYPLVFFDHALFDQNIEIRDGWIMMKEDK